MGFVRCLLLVATVVTAKTGQLGAQSLRLFKGNLELDAGRFRFPPSPHEETQVALSKRKPERSHLVCLKAAYDAGRDVFQYKTPGCISFLGRVPPKVKPSHEGREGSASEPEG